MKSFALQGREDDAEAAIKVLGYRRYAWAPFGMAQRFFAVLPPGEIGLTRTDMSPSTGQETPFSDALRDVPLFSTNMGDAWLLVEALREKFAAVVSIEVVAEGTHVVVEDREKRPGLKAVAFQDTTAKAITIAASLYADLTAEFA